MLDAMPKTAQIRIISAISLRRGPVGIVRHFFRQRKMHNERQTVDRGGLRGYRSAEAQSLSQARRREAHKARKITTEVRQWIATLIRQALSSEQVVDYLALHKHLSLRHETV